MKKFWKFWKFWGEVLGKFWQEVLAEVLGTPTLVKEVLGTPTLKFWGHPP